MSMRHFPSLMEEFGGVTTLLLMGKDGNSLPDDPFIIGESVEGWAGPIERCTIEDKGTKYVLRSRNQAQVKKLLQLTELADGTQVTVVLHPKLNTSRCVISAPSLLRISEERIVEKLSGQGVTDVKRIMRNKENTPAVILTFNRAAYPDKIEVGLQCLPTRPYYPNPLLCYHCFEYGHARVRCTNEERCYNCSGTHEKVEACEADPFCCNCQKGHRPNSRQCEAYKYESDVVHTKTDFGLTYPEARKRVDAGNGSYAKVAAQPRLDQARLDALTKSLQDKQERIVKLEEEIVKRQSLEDKLNEMIEQSRAKEAIIEELLNCLKEKDEKIRIIEAQNQSMKNIMDEMQIRSRSDSNTSQPQSDSEVGKKKKKRQNPPIFTDSQKPTSSGMSPPHKKATSNHRSPIRTRTWSNTAIDKPAPTGDTDSRRSNHSSEPHT